MMIEYLVYQSPACPGAVTLPNPELLSLLSAVRLHNKYLNSRLFVL